MDYLVTGGLGFIGQNLVRALLDAGQAVRVLDNCETHSVNPEYLSRLGAEVITGDIRDPRICLKAADGIEVIIHLAAKTGVASSIQDPVGNLEVNTLGTLHLLDVARLTGAKRFVFASSNAVFGDHAPPFHEGLIPRPRTPYGVHKLAAEGLCRCYYENFGLWTVALRFANVYGPGSQAKESVVARFMKSILAGRPIEVFGDGRQSRDFICVDDIVEAIRRAVEFSPAGEVFTIGTETETSVHDLVERLRRVVSSDGWSGPFPDVQYRLDREGDTRRSFSSIDRARKLLGFEPVVDLEAGLRQTWQWFRERVLRKSPDVPALPGVV
jgi:UDP-glucose 4-epimerase